MRPWYLLAPCLTLLAAGCSEPEQPVPVFQPGDVVRPEVSFAPTAPWPAEAKVSVGVLFRIERPGGQTRYLMDEDVPIEQVGVSGRVTFLDGERALGDPQDVSLVHDC